MKTPITCPDCGRVTAFPVVHLGRRFKCPGCGAAVATRKPEVDEPYAPPRAKIGPKAEGRGTVETGPNWHFHIQVKRDPARRLKGVFKAELTPQGLILRKPKGDEEVARIAVGTPVHHDSGPTFRVERGGREVVLVVTQRGVYGYRLAADLVAFLGKTREMPLADEYTIPRPLMMAAYAPLLIAFVGMSGGALGGGIGGGIGGGLLTANLAIVRKESWSVAARTWACIAVTVGGTTFFGGLIVAIALMIRKENGPPPAPNVPFAAPPGGRFAAPPAPNFAPPADRFAAPPADPNFAPPEVVSVVPEDDPNRRPPHARFPPGSAAPANPGPSVPAPYVAPRTPPSATDIEDLIGYWPLDEPEGSKAADASGQMHQATLTNARRVDGIRGRAVRFDGDGFLDLGDSTDFNFARGESFTIAGWFRSSEWEGPLVSLRKDNDGAPVVDIVLESRTVTATIRPNGTETAVVARLVGKPIQDDAWHHFAVVRRGLDAVELYLDGQMHERTTGNNIGGAITTDLRASGSERYWVKTGWAAPHYLKGVIDEICLFHRDLRVDEVRRLAGR